MAEELKEYLLDQNQEGKFLARVLHFKNPFDPDDEKQSFLKQEKDMKEAQKQILRILKTKKKHQYGKEILPQIIQMRDELIQSSKKQKFTNKIFIKWMISVVSHFLTKALKVDSHDLFYSRDKDEIFLRIFVKQDWLRNQAFEQKYRLQFRDPNIDQERQPFMEVPPYTPFETRKSGAVPDYQRFYKHYDIHDNQVEQLNQGSLFKFTDKVRLFHVAFDQIFDCNAMKDFGVLLSDFCVQDQRNLDKLKHGWARIKAMFKKQPINHIRDYFGQSVALYFAWMSMYQSFMIIAAIVGLAVFIYDIVIEKTEEIVITEDFTVSQIVWIAFATFMAFWASLFDQFWERKQKTLSWKWGTVNFYQQEEPRAEFKGRFQKDPVSGRMKKIRVSQRKYLLRRIFSYSVATLFVCLVITAVGGIFFYRSLVKKTDWGPTACGVANAIQIKIMNIIYGLIAHWMNDWENHQTKTQYQNNLAVKLFLFKFVNSYSSLFYIGFVKQYLEGCSSESGCMDELRIQLATIFLINLFMNIIQLGIPWLKWRVELHREENKIKKKNQKRQDKFRLEMGPVQTQGKLEEYESPLDDYMEMIIQFGYVALFGIAFPIIALFSLMEITLEIRVDAWKLCNLTKRPDPHRAEDIGVWKSIVVIISYVGTITNAAIVVFTSGLFDHLDSLWLAVMFIAIEHVLFFGKFLTAVAIQDRPQKAIDAEIWGERVAKECLFGSQGYQATFLGVQQEAYDHEEALVRNKDKIQYIE